ncbi:hypothetical protein [Delftia acidovorans]|uniref:hypothetical protein n=1 Tax=Delftia acidovorans TaxID=80866 RepID=UPI00283B2763|nr:hypothetical protein [Delftia acidovorans]
MNPLRFPGAVLAHALAVCTAVLAAAPLQAQTGAEPRSCRADAHAVGDTSAAEPPVTWPRQGAPLALTPSCWMSPAEWRQRLVSPGAQAAMLVDVRPAQHRRASPVTQAMQMDLQELQGKRFLMQEEVILLGTGLDHADLDAACRQLRSQGFAGVKALQGGAATALHPRAPAGLQDLSASDWIASLGQGLAWTVLSLSKALDASPVVQSPVDAQQTHRLDATHDLAIQLNAIASRKARGDQPGVSASRALVVMADASTEPELRARLAMQQASLGHRPDAVPVFWLLGGWQAYQAQVASMQAIGTTAGHRLQAACGRF